MTRCLFILLFTLFSLHSANATKLSGTASYRERIAMPPVALFRAVLYDVSKNGQVEIGRFEASGDAGPPYGFTIEYSDDAVSDDGLYAIQAQVVWPDRMFFAAGAKLDGFPADRNPKIDLIMVRPGGSPANTAMKPSKNNPSVGAHGLRLPATFQGTLKTGKSDVDWHLSLWPDQTFQLKRTFHDDAGHTRARSSLGRWHADPANDAVLLRDGAEMPLLVRNSGQDTLQVIDANTGQAAEDPLVSDGSLDPTDLDAIFIGGMMTYMADAALIEECLTGTRFPLVQDDDYLALEKAYLADRPGPGERLYVMLEGGIAMREAMGGPQRQMVTVNKFIRTRPGIACERQKANAALRNTYWRLDQVDGTVVPIGEAQQEPHMVLESDDAGSYRATVGCNRMRGAMNIDGDAVSFSPAASTMMACPPPLDGLERQFGEMLSEASRFAIEGETLVLSDGAGKTRGIFTAIYF